MLISILKKVQFMVLLEKMGREKLHLLELFVDYKSLPMGLIRFMEKIIITVI